MIRRDGLLLLGILVATLRVGLPTSLHAQASTTIPHDEALGFSMSGGVSLGAYQAGVLAVVFNRLHPAGGDSRYARAASTPIGLAGASAGNINAILGAIEWCREVPSPVEASLFRDVWTSIGIEELIGDRLDTYVTNRPITGTRGREPDEAIFSRGYLRDTVIVEIDALIDEPEFRSGCELPVALMVNRSEPRNLLPSPPGSDSDTLPTFASAHAMADAARGDVRGSTAIPNTRFATLLGVKTKEGRLILTSFPYLTPDDSARIPPPDLGGWITPGVNPNAPREEVEIPFSDVMEFVLASSAFPVAFAPVRLRYWSPTYQYEDEPPCPESLCREDAYFLDGGTFDNHPLLAAQRMATIARSHGLARSNEVGADETSRPDAPRVISVDTDIRRGPADTLPEASEPDRAVGFEQLLSLADGFVSTARSYELQSMARFAPEVIHSTSSSTRAWPIYGERLGNFGAFFSKAFREVDFYLGVYDGVYFVAERFECGDAEGARGCLLDELESAPATLALGACGRAVVTVALGIDFEDRKLTPDEIRREASACDRLGALRGRIAGEVLAEMLIDLQHPEEVRCDRGSIGLKALCDNGFTRLGARLRENSAITTAALRPEPFLEGLRSDEARLADRLVLLFIDRAWRAAAYASPGGAGERIVETAHMLHESTVRTAEPFELGPGLAPRNDSRRTRMIALWLAAPSGVRMLINSSENDRDDFGAEFLWIARTGLPWDRLALDLRPRLELATERTNFHLGATVTGIANFVPSEVAAGVEWSPGDDQRWWALLGVRLLADQLAVEVRHPIDDGPLAWDRVAVSVGLGDAHGVVYWLSRLM
ncbi:MAG: patatin-like phospholipase family protein [Longimicrobiales bacterium]|nr:patatin-like phospholipase family protein [Longimicrobiales bacterium]